MGPQKSNSVWETATSSCASPVWLENWTEFTASISNPRTWKTQQGWHERLAGVLHPFGCLMTACHCQFAGTLPVCRNGGPRPACVEVTGMGMGDTSTPGPQGL